MKTRKVQVSAKKLEALVSQLRNMPPDIVGDHFSSEEFVEYTTDMCTAEEVRRLDEHLDSCPECAMEVERLLQGSAAWEGEQGRNRLAALRKKIEALPSRLSLRERLAQVLQQAQESLQAFFQQPVWAAADRGDERRKFWEWQSPDGMLKGHGVLEQSGDVTFRLSSQELALEETPLVFCWGALQREVILHRVSATEVGAKIEISRHQRPSEMKDISLKLSTSSEGACESDDAQ